MSQKVSTLESTRGAGSNSRLGVNAENRCQAPCSRGDALTCVKRGEGLVGECDLLLYGAPEDRTG